MVHIEGSPLPPERQVGRVTQAAAVIEHDFSFFCFCQIGFIVFAVRGVKLGELIEAAVGARLVFRSAGAQGELSETAQLVQLSYKKRAFSGFYANPHTFIFFPVIVGKKHRYRGRELIIL
ncbi:hypothetical protein FQZ97_846050 [compost metagenome]